MYPVLSKACKNARRALSKQGIRTLGRIPVYFDWFDLNSGCFEEPTIKIGIGWFHAPSALLDVNACTALMVHEYAHAALYQLWPQLTRKERGSWEKVFGSYEDDPAEDPYPSPWEIIKSYAAVSEDTYDTTRFVSEYATVSAQEDWAETLMHVTLNNEIINTRTLTTKVRCVKKYAQLHKTRVS